MSYEQSIQTALEELRRLRDEIRVKMRLGEMDVRAWWEGVEPKLEDIERQIESTSSRASGTASVVADEIAAALQRIRDRVSEKRDQPQV